MRPIEEPPSAENKQADSVLKEAHAKNVEDLQKMEKLLAEVRAEVGKDSAFVLSLQSIKKLEEIEKLSKAIRARMKLN